MDEFTIPHEEVAPILNLAPGVAGLRILMVNVFALSGEQGWVLVDAGLTSSASRIQRWTEGLFPRQPRPDAIVLTHGHFDHTGALKELADLWDVPVYAHEKEIPYLTGREEYPAPNPSVDGGMMSLLSQFYPRGPVDVSPRIHVLNDHGKLPVLPQWRWIHTPGHTEGHVSLFRESDCALIVGDAFCTTKADTVAALVTQKPELHGPPAYCTSDWDKAALSVDMLASLRPSTVAPGHGMPMSGADIPAALSQLASNFDRVVRPHHGSVAA